MEHSLWNVHSPKTTTNMDFPYYFPRSGNTILVDPRIGVMRVAKSRTMVHRHPDDDDARERHPQHRHVLLRHVRCRVDEIRDESDERVQRPLRQLSDHTALTGWGRFLVATVLCSAWKHTIAATRSAMLQRAFRFSNREHRSRSRKRRGGVWSRTIAPHPHELVRRST